MQLSPSPPSPPRSASPPSRDAFVVGLDDGDVVVVESEPGTPTLSSGPGSVTSGSGRMRSKTSYSSFLFSASDNEADEVDEGIVLSDKVGGGTRISGMEAKLVRALSRRVLEKDLPPTPTPRSADTATKRMSMAILDEDALEEKERDRDRTPTPGASAAYNPHPLRHNQFQKLEKYRPGSRHPASVLLDDYSDE